MTKVNSFIVFLFIIMVGCSPIDKKLDTWNTRLCCQNESTKFVLDDFKMVEKKSIEFELCDNSNNGRLNLTLSYKNGSKYEPIFDLISNEGEVIKNKVKINLNERPENFTGDFNKTDYLQDGLYRLYLSKGGLCGEIKIDLNSNKYSTDFMCVKNCND